MEFYESFMNNEVPFHIDVVLRSTCMAKHLDLLALILITCSLPMHAAGRALV